MPGSISVSNRTSRSLVYGLSLLRQFTAEQPVLGIAELADVLDVSRPTAHRYASTCLELGYLEQAPMRRYRLARRAAEPGLAMLGSLALTRRAQPILRQLRRDLGRTASLAILDGEEALYLQRLCGFAHGQYELERGLGAGTRRPALRTAAGRALMHSSGEKPPEPKQILEDEIVILEGSLRANALGLAIAIPAPGEPTGAIELTVPMQAMSTQEASTDLGEPLRAAAKALRTMLAEDCASDFVAI